MRVYDNRITQADAARRLKNMAKLGHKAVAGVDVETTVVYTQHLEVVTLVLDSAGHSVEAYYLRRSGQARKAAIPEKYMPTDAPGIRPTAADVLTVDTEAVLAAYKRWAKARYLLDNPGGERDWERMEQKEQDAIRRHWERTGPAS